MKTTFIAFTTLAACVACGSSALAGVAFSGRAESSAGWDGFGADFSPSWVGKTTIVENTPENVKALTGLTSASVSSCSMMSCVYPLFGYEQRWTVNRISSSACAKTDVDASFLLGDTPYAASWGNWGSDSESNHASFANYAEIVTYDNRVLANASAIAFQDAQLGDRSFDASGKVSTATLLHNGSTSAQSSAMGSSCFTASYGLEKDTPFSFSLDLASAGNVDLVFSASDLATGETLWSLTPSRSDEIRHIEWSGVLEAGQYSFALDASADSLIDQDGVQSFDGQALYNVSFDFNAESYWVARSFTVDSNANWSPSGSNPGSSTVPEPNVLTLLLAGFLFYAAGKKRG